MAILNSDDLLKRAPELASLDTTRLEAVLLNANTYVESLLEVALPATIPEDLKLAVALVAKDMVRERRVTAVKQGDYQESFTYANNDPQVERILKNYKKGRSLWMI